MRNISFALTTAQIRARTKDVTRRMGWLMLRAGDRLMACEKCMGRKAGQPLVRLCVIEVVTVRRERLDRITAAEVAREGFPEWTPAQFVDFFCAANGCKPSTTITRIVFRYLEAPVETGTAKAMPLPFVPPVL